MAREDLDASIVLYDAGHYPQSVFLLQQAVEKAAKSFSIRFGIITEKDAAHCIGHKPLNIVGTMVKKINRNLRSIPDTEAHVSDAGFEAPQSPKSVDATERELDAYLKSLETFDLSETDAHELVAALKETHDSFASLLQPVEKEGIPAPIYDQISVDLERFYRIYYSSSALPETEKAEMIRKIPEITRETMSKWDQMEPFLFVFAGLMESMFLLLHLARATGPHAVKARYPDAKTGFDPLDYYTHDRPIVAALPDLHTYTGIVLKDLSRLSEFIASPPEMTDLTTAGDSSAVPPAHQEDHP